MEHVRTVSREFETGEKAVLHLESRSGSVIVEGRESDRVVVDAVLRVSSDLSTDADDAAALVERNMEQDQHRVIVRAPTLQPSEGWGIFFGHKSARIDYHVRVPRRTAVRVLSKSGTVEIMHTQGVLYCEGSSGKIGINDIEGEVSVVSRSGGLQIEGIKGSLNVESRSGKLRVRGVEGPVTVESRSGTCEIIDITGEVRLTARSGSLAMENIDGRLQARSHAGAVRYRGVVSDDMEIEAHAGSITFAVDPASLFFIDASSDVGSVRSDLPPRGKGAAPPEGGPKVRLRTRAGSIRLTRA